MAVYGDLYRYRELFASLFQRDLRAKYKGSVLGLFWTLALPVTLMLVYLVVFSVLLNSRATDIDHYWLFLLCGLPAWVFFANSLQSSARSLLENASLIRKVRFPRQLVPLSIVATQLVAFAVMTAIVLVLSIIVLPDSRATAWLVIPIAAVIVLFVSGLSLHDAVNRPRIHVHRAGRPDEVVKRETDLTMYFGGVGATLVTAEGHLVAAADPRREGAVRVVHR